MRFVDMHCDTISEILKERRAGRVCELRENAGQLDLVRMKEGDYLLQNFALFVNIAKCENPWEEVNALLEVYEEELDKNKDMIGRVLQYEDIVQNQQQGRLSALLTVEEGAVCMGDVGKLRTLYDKGVRMMTLTWNHENELGYPAGSDSGLTDKGKEFVMEMETLGIIPDVSHLSDVGFRDVLEITKKPFVASHSNARSVCNVPRNMTDDMIRKLGERGGCMGLNFYQAFLLEEPERDRADSQDRTQERTQETTEKILTAIARHAKHIVNCGGIEVLGLGSDFDGIPTNEAIPGAQSMEILYHTFQKAGFTESDLDKITQKNVLRVYKNLS